MNKKITPAEFKVWKDNLEPNGNMPVLTTDAIIDLDDLDLFLKEIRSKNANGIKINLVRFDWKKNEPQIEKDLDDKFPIGCQWSVAENNKTQVGIAINGTIMSKMKADYTTETKDIILDDGKILLLIPGGEQKGPISLNPPKTTKPGGS